MLSSDRLQPGTRLIGLILLALITLVCTALPSRAQKDHRVLVLIEAGSRLPLTASMLAGMEEVLSEDFMSRGETYVEFLDMLRFTEPYQQRLVRELIVARYGGTDLDAVVVLGPNALRFTLENRDRMAPGALVLAAAITKDQFAEFTAEPNVTAFFSGFDPIATVDLARKLQPDAHELVVVSGSAVFDRDWHTSVTRIFGDSYQGLPVRYLADLSFDRLRSEMAALDPASIVLFTTLMQDSTGRRFIPREALRELSEETPAPIYGVYYTYLGHGVLGGMMEDPVETGRVIGRYVLRIIGGEVPAASITVPSQPMVDWTQMVRWRIDRAALPEGAGIANFAPTIWDRYWPVILLVSAIVLAQTATITGLLLQRRRARRAQTNLERERQQLVHVSRNVRLGQLSGALAHEINQPLTAILANAEAGARMLRQDPPDLQEVAEILEDIADDDRRASGIITDLRRLMVKGETKFERVDLNDLVRATLSLANSEFQARGARVEQQLSHGPLTVLANPPQLQQIILNLTLNAAEAMDALPSAERVVQVSTRDLPGGQAELAVQDAGPGISPEQREAIFDPFVSTKLTGMGIGLSICLNIATAHGGKLFFDDQLPPGARAVLILPIHGGTA